MLESDEPVGECVEREEAGGQREGQRERIIFELDDDARQISWYQLSSGDSIVVVIDEP